VSAPGARQASLSARVKALRAAPLFGELSQASLARVARCTSEVDFPAGRVLIERGQKGAGMFVVLDGKVVVEARGKRRAELGPGEVVGELALLTPAGVRTARVSAKTPVRCLALSRTDFSRVLDADPKLARALLRILAERIARTL
jgi:CRP-like cAMP-binding protein